MTLELKLPTEPSRIACTGSRRLLENEIDYCKQIGKWLAKLGHTVVSGGAVGADLAYMNAAAEAGGTVVAVLPWEDYNRGLLPPTAQRMVYGRKTAIHQHWFDLAREVHPAWERCSRGAMALLARNVGILVGETPEERVKLLFAYPGAGPSGGTQHGIRVARALDIPVFNLQEMQYVA